MGRDDRLTWDWIPGVRIGPFRFGEPIDPRIMPLLTEAPPSMTDADWTVMIVGDEYARVSLEDGRIESVECCTSCVLRGEELIGRAIDDIADALEPDLVLAEDYDDGDQRWESDAAGLMLWLENGRIESVTVGRLHP